MTGKIISPETARFSRRSRIARREWRERRNGSTDPAGPCVRLDPVSGKIIETVDLVAADLITGPPKLAAWKLHQIKSDEVKRAEWRERKDRQIERENTGAVVLPHNVVIDEDLMDRLAGLGCFIGRERTNPQDVAEAIIDYLRDAVMSRR
jgi:hypothetical protein